MNESEFPRDGANATQFDSVLTGDKKLFVKTYGCQMNVYDSERMSDVLAPHGFVSTDSPEDADLIVLNTCHIREKAAEKVYSDLGRMRALGPKRARRGRETLIAVAGCVAQAEGAEIIRRAPAVDFVFGPQVLHRLGDLVVRARAGERVVETEFPVEDKFALMPHPARKIIAARGPTAFLTVQEGCDKFCTFCVVPYTRGSEVSRPVAAIVDEAERLVDAGVVEITLIGQNVNAYHGAGEDGAPSTLARLIGRLARIDGLARLRYTTSHPRDMDAELIAAHGEVDILMPYLHLPIQSGSDRVLGLMNRRHTVDDYRDIVASLRAVRPDIALSSDFIVGFPGETQADFEATLAIAAEFGYAQAYSFKYSARPGTPAAESTEQVAEQEKAHRLARLQAVLDVGQRAFNAMSVGKTMAVLLDRSGRKPGQLAGRSPYLQAVHVDAPEAAIGTIRQVCVTAAGPNSLAGALVGRHRPARVAREGAVL